MPGPPNLPDLEIEIRELYAAYAAPLHSYAATLGRDPDAAADAVQETFLRYFAERTYGGQIDNARAWLFRVLHNWVLDRMKSAGGRQEVDGEELERMPDVQPDPEAAVRRRQCARQVKGLLSRREWQCLRMRCAGMEYREIGAAMGLRIGTVGALLARATAKIRRAGDRPSAAEALGSLAAEAHHE